MTVISIVVDSTADLPAHLCAQHAIRVVPLLVQFGTDSYRDGVDISHDAFYTRLTSLADSEELPKTSTPPIGAFVEVYEQLAQETDTILSLHISGKLSSTVQTARQAAQMVPQAHIEVIDTTWASMVVGALAVAASEAAAAGATLDELRALVHEMSQRAFIYIGFDTLRFLERGGRIGHARALLGTLLRIKPIIEMTGGELRPLEQVRTTRRMVGRLRDLAAQQVPLESLAVLYSSDPQPAEDFREQFLATGALPPDAVRVVQVGGVIGTHIGPGGLGLAGLRQRTG